MKLNPQAIKIFDILKDWKTHCPIEWGYADGHTKRITDINRHLEPQGLKVISEWCDCGRHNTRILARRIAPIVQKVINHDPQPQNPATGQIGGKFPIKKVSIQPRLLEYQRTYE